METNATGETVRISRQTDGLIVAATSGGRAGGGWNVGGNRVQKSRKCHGRKSESRY